MADIIDMSSLVDGTCHRLDVPGWQLEFVIDSKSLEFVIDSSSLIDNSEFIVDLSLGMKTDEKTPSYFYFYIFSENMIGSGKNGIENG
jgi:hypothetical protein